MRGESLDDFLKTRNTQVIYSVAGNDAGRDAAWNAPPEPR